MEGKGRRERKKGREKGERRVEEGKGRKIEEKTWRKRKKERRKERKKGYNAKTGRKNVQVDYERGRRVVGGKRKDGEVGRPKGRTRTRKGLRK